MNREAEYVASHRPYAVDLGSYRFRWYKDDPATGYGMITMSAFWYRRRSGYNIAVVGSLYDGVKSEPESIETFLNEFTDGRYGGAARSRWDGQHFWSASQDPEVTGRDLDLLEPTLEAFPDIPDGYDGWWTFH